MAARLALPGFQSRRAFRFGVVGLSGLVVNQIALLAFTEALGVFYVVASILATQVSSTWNFLVADRWVFGGRSSRRSTFGRFGGFLALNNATLLARIPMLWALTEIGGVHYLWSNAITLGLMFLFRFAVADGWIWASGANDREADTSPPALKAEDKVIRYSIAGILRIESDVPLRELSHFRTLEEHAPNLVIRVGRVGGLPMTRTRFVDAPPSLRYLEHLGAASANFQIVMGEPITVRVAPLLASSPHVLYTNVIEALLRFLLVSRDHVLLHSACVMVDGRAVLLSAQTDTGKTSTVIQLVRDRAYKFLSDDMTIIAPDGVAIQYPKPMTMSYHTMSAISGHRLPFRQRAALAVQSRLHSKSGRTVGRHLGSMNIPIMTINSVVQWLVPPPKFHISDLLECEVVERAPIGHVFIMERGESMQRRERPATAVPTLIENTDDAYGFPPFATFAPRLRIGDDDYAALRAKEELLLRRAIARAAVWRVRVPGHEWAEVLPELISKNGQVPRSSMPSDTITRLRPIPIVTAVDADDLAHVRQPSI